MVRGGEGGAKINGGFLFRDKQGGVTSRGW